MDTLKQMQTPAYKDMINQRIIQEKERKMNPLNHINQLEEEIAGLSPLRSSNIRTLGYNQHLTHLIGNMSNEEL